MNDLEFVALLLAVVGPLIVLVRLLRVPQSLALVGAGIGSTFVPGLPSTQVDPQILLTLFLPPIIYAAAVQVSVHLLRFTLLPGVLVGFALTAATIPAVAVAARWLLPDLGWTQALMLGGIVALFDTRLFDDVEGSPHVPRAITDALKARSIAARVAAFSIFTLLLDAVEGGAPAPLAAVASFAWSIGAGSGRSSSSWIGPTSSSAMSSSVMIPPNPPYSSTTQASWRWPARSRSSTAGSRSEAGTSNGSVISSVTGTVERSAGGTVSCSPGSSGWTTRARWVSRRCWTARS